MKTLTRSGIGWIRFGWQTNNGKVSKGERYAKAKLKVAINRYNCGMTVGHGFYKHFTKTNPVGAECRVYGAFGAGSYMVELPEGGFSALGTADVEIYDTSELTSDERDYLSKLPTNRSNVISGEIDVDNLREV